MTLGVSDKQPWQLQVTHNSDLRDILLYLNCFLICWVSRNIADKDRSFCQPSSHQIICPAILYLIKIRCRSPHAFSVCTHESLSNLSCVMWQACQVSHGWGHCYCCSAAQWPPPWPPSWPSSPGPPGDAHLPLECDYSLDVSQWWYDREWKRDAQRQVTRYLCII